MPSAMVGNNAVQSAIPDLGSGSNSESIKQVLAVIDKKVRNMEKKKVFVVTKKNNVLSKLLLFISKHYVRFVFCLCECVVDDVIGLFSRVYRISHKYLYFYFKFGEH